MVGVVVGTRQNFGPHARDATWSLEQTIASWVFANCFKKFTNGTLGTLVVNNAFGGVGEFSVNCFVGRHIQNAIGGLSRQSHLNEIGQRTGLLRGREPLVCECLAQPP